MAPRELRLSSHATICSKYMAALERPPISYRILAMASSRNSPRSNRIPVFLRHANYSPSTQRLSSNTSIQRPRAELQVQTVTAAQHAEHLASQRRSRPVTPHLSIYQPQIHWVSGALMRNSAILITAPVYIFGAAYLVSPAMGWQLDTANMVEWFGGLPVGSRLAIKGFFGFPFVFHIVHGLKHLVWDTGAMLTNRQVHITGWLGLGASLLGTVGLMFW